uniref:Max-binding protein MNT n=1 Tax=Nothobranchius korthausae TaxID=1143690 RepID=A0A1A8GFB5_9TELE
MSIETLLEAAKFLELQAQQQQKAREDELSEKLRLQQKTDYSCPDGNCNSTDHINNVSKAEPLRAEFCPAPIPPSLPVTIIPIPVVTPNPTASPTLSVTTLSPPAAPSLASPLRDPHSPQEQSAAGMLCFPPPRTDHSAPSDHMQPIQNHHHHLQLIEPVNNTKPLQQLVHCYPGSVVSAPQHHALLPHPGPVLQPTPPQNAPISQGSPTDDSRLLDSKKRPGGAGTREVHNKLEKNRRAHLKECFETLKKNIPNIDEKKTSNLSVLRSALRYIQTLRRKEKEYEHDMERLAREKIATQQRLAELKNELNQWMDVMEIDRILRQTVQPEEDQASTSTASEGEDIMDEDLSEDTAEETRSSTQSQTPPGTAVPTSIITQHISTQNNPPQPQSILPAPPPCTPTAPTQPPISTQTHIVTTSNLHPTVIAHASMSHPSVIQAVNHVIHGVGPKHIPHLAPSTTSSHQPIGHITVHSVAHLGQHIPTLYPQPVAVTQPAVVGHITHTLNHGHPHMNGTSPTQAAIVGKQGAVSAQMMAHHPQLVGQTVLNPVTMVTMPSFPISTLKLA